MKSSFQMAQAVKRQERAQKTAKQAMVRAGGRKRLKRQKSLDAPFTKAQLHPDEKNVGEKTYSPGAQVASFHAGPEGTQQERQEALKANKTIVPELNKLTAERNAALGRHFSQSSKPTALPGTGRSAAAAIISSVPGKNANLKGTPSERQGARQKLRKAKKVLRRSNPDLSALTPAQQEVARLSMQAHKKYPDVPVSVMMGDTEQESNFDASAVSSAGAVGLTQFIPSTAASYGVKAGTGKAEKRSQVFGQAKLLHDLQAEHPGGIKEALGNYYGDPSASYSGEVLGKAQQYTFLDAKGNPQAVKNYKAAVAEAKELGLRVSKGKTVSAGPPPQKLVKRTVAAEKAMRAIEGSPYVWGGGHQSFQSEGYDCSGAVSFVLHAIGDLKSPLSSGNMGQALKPGPGALTIFYNDTHTFLRLINKKGEAEYWGTSVGDSGSGGLTSHPAPSADYLAEYNVGHVPGMGKKQALQLGATPGSLSGATSEAFPGMTVSSGGTTATIDTGAGTTQTDPGFSKKPILPQDPSRVKLNKVRTIRSHFQERQKDLEHIGKEDRLDELMKKYGTPVA